MGKLVTVGISDKASPDSMPKKEDRDLIADMRFPWRVATLAETADTDVRCGGVEVTLRPGNPACTIE